MKNHDQKANALIAANRVDIAYKLFKFRSDPEKTKEIVLKDKDLAKSDIFVLRNLGGYIFGYVSYNKEDGDFQIIFRGTKNFHDMKVDADIRFAKMTEISGATVMAAKGFLDSARYIWLQIQKIIEVVGKDKIKSVTVSGHSLGGAIASIISVFVRQTLDCPINLITFGSPRVFDQGGAEYWSKLGITGLRFTKGNTDIVTAISPGAAGFKHIGDAIDLQNISYDTHKMQDYLIGLASVKTFNISSSTPYNSGFKTIRKYVSTIASMFIKPLLIINDLSLSAKKAVTGWDSGVERLVVVQNQEIKVQTSDESFVMIEKPTFSQELILPRTPNQKNDVLNEKELSCSTTVMSNTAIKFGDLSATSNTIIQNDLLVEGYVFVNEVQEKSR